MDKFLTVKELNGYVLDLMAQDELLSNLLLKGEISGLRLYQKSGHMYFTLKDDTAAVSCVMFKSQVQNLDFVPEDGREVLLQGRVSVFVKQGRYQVYVETMQPFGLGELFLYLEQLKEKLARKGYFDLSSKKNLPGQVRRLGVVSSRHGAAVRDIIKVVRELNPGVEIIVAHALVQGDSAPRQIVQALNDLNEYGQVDVIIVARGGGSIEDLMAFNSEEVVQAVFASEIPVISAVGHEVDVTLADLAADVRAATPTQGAQLAVRDRRLSQAEFIRLRARMIGAMNKKLLEYEELLDRLMMKKVWKEARYFLEFRMKYLRNLHKNLVKASQSFYKDKKHQYSLLQRSLEGLSPGNLMHKGYVLLYKEGRLIRDIAEIDSGDSLHVRLKGGYAEVEVKEIHKSMAKDFF